MKRILQGLGFSIAALAYAPMASAQAPTADTLKQVLQQRLQKLRPEGTSERSVLFQEVRAGTPNGGEYPFLVTAQIRDYEPGYPANRYYGQTCVGRMAQRKFYLSLDEFGQWKAEGAMTVTSGPDRTCKPNPSAGVSSIPLGSLQGSAAPAGAPPVATAPAARGATSTLAAGEWACYGTGGRLLIGLGFRVASDGKYTDLDRKNPGTYTLQGGAITFRGGHLDGQTGRNLRGNHFDMSGTVSCEIFH
jgi:hypothetical protein